jgi:hypothetical protein
VPQDGLPPFGKRLERLRDQRPVGVVEGGGVGCGHDRFGYLVEGGLGGRRRELGGVAAQRDEQVGPERVGRTGTVPDGADHPLERRVDQVVGVAEPAVGRGETLRCRLVPQVELGEGRLVAAACLVEQLGVGERRDRHM